MVLGRRARVGADVPLGALLFDLVTLAVPSGWAAFDFAIPHGPGTVGHDVVAQALTRSAAGFGLGNGVALRLAG